MMQEAAGSTNDRNDSKKEREENGRPNKKDNML